MAKPIKPINERPGRNSGAHTLSSKWATDKGTHTSGQRPINVEFRAIAPGWPVTWELPGSLASGVPKSVAINYAYVEDRALPIVISVAPTAMRATSVRQTASDPVSDLY